MPNTRAWLGLIVLLTAHSAVAFDPNAGATDIAPLSRPQQRQVIPARYYNTAQTLRAIPETRIVAQPHAIVTSPSAPAPVVNVVPPAPMMPSASATPARRYVPAEQPDVNAPVADTVVVAYTPPPAPVMAEPAPVVTPTAPAALHRDSTSLSSDQFSIGIEGFYSNYKEHIVTLDEHGGSGSITASYTHFLDPNWYATLDLRGSYGMVDYSSTSGTIDNIKQWETENRLLAGYTRPVGENRLKLYTGLGARYFSDEAKGTVSSLGASGYDRRIFQLYVPLGVTYEFASGGFDFAPNLELDPVFWGNVSSRLGNIPGYYYVENHQSAGIGARSEFMMGRLSERGEGWQFGPFVRYWYFPDSDRTTDPGNTSWTEPRNTRLQAGAALKFLF